MQVKFEYTIEKVKKLDNGEIEIVATGVSTESIATSVSPEMEMIMRSIPPQMQDLINQQQKLFQNSQRPLLKFRLTAEEYASGVWRVGDTLAVTVAVKQET
jgi:hypothetical protein